MREWCLAGFFAVTFFFTIGAGAGDTGEGGSDGATIDSLSGQAWTLVALTGQEVGPGPAVTIRFETDATLSGFDGCNRYRGGFSVEGSALRIPHELVTTRMACSQPLMRRAHAYAQALARTTVFAIEGSRLSLRDSADKQLAVFEADGLTLAGTSWEVIAYNNGKQAVVSVINGTHITALFGDDAQVTGSAGCNQYFAEYLAVDESITIGLAGATRRYCAEHEGVMDQEAHYLEALRSAATFRLEGGRLTLRAGDGALAVTLVRDQAGASSPGPGAKSRIRFDLARLNADGLQGAPDGLRALHYEYCIPDRPETIGEVTAIDPTLQIQRDSPGRAGCGVDELLCLGHTHQSGYRAVLERLAELPFVVNISETLFE